MADLSLRVRVFLFFCLIGLGSLVAICLGLWLGYRQLGVPDALSAFVSAGLLAGFATLGLVTLVWMLFDENVSKPIDRLAASFRTHAVSDVVVEDKTLSTSAKYLGDLAPAADAIQTRLGQAAETTAETVIQKTARLERQQAQLLRILSDIPTAVILASPNHEVVLYDGQAAELMEREAPARLKASVFDYLDQNTIKGALTKMQADQADRQEIVINGPSGSIYTGHIRLFEGNAGYTLMLDPLTHDAARPLVFDFDLLNKSNSEDDEVPLRDLVFTVFDSETTGLDPSKDEVVQLGAVRVVNGRVITAETFDTLVNPGRPIPASSTKVHHITDTMVADAPGFLAVRAAFHKYAKGSVLIAHNAPFDLAFLHRPGGSAFDNPVLDTVHLSAIAFGASAEHTLDALSARLGIVIPTEHRHTALGDAMATAKVFAALLPILEERDLKTMAQLQNEARKHSRILKVAS